MFFISCLSQKHFNILRLNNKMRQLFITFLALFLIIIHCTLISAQAPATAPAAPLVEAPPATPLVEAPPADTAVTPAPTGPTDVTTILKKDGHFTIFIRLLQRTKVGDTLNLQLSDDSNTGLTVFSPTDSAFSSLKTGTLNSYTDEQKTELVQFHVLPYYLSPSQFQTASNPLRTQAGTSSALFSMNVTAIGNQVNITTGETNATVANTIYTDNKLAVYQVDKVLLPLRFYVPMPPPPPPPPPPAKKAAPKPVYVAPIDSSSEILLTKMVLRAMACVMLVYAMFP